MKRLESKLKKALIFCITFIVYSLLFINNAPAAPPPPPPPSVPAGGDVAQAVALGVIAVYGMWRIWRKK